MSITDPADCEVRSVIRFSNAKNVRPAETHRQLVEVYGEDVVNKWNVCNREGQTCTMMRDLDARLFHDTARPHTAEKTTKLLEKFGWENLDHHPYSPDLTPSDFHLFPKMKEFWPANVWQLRK
jgi:hypothetical protein